MQKTARLTLRLTGGGSPKVKKGDHVKRGDILISAKFPTIYEFNLADLFKLTPKKALTTLMIKPGQMVEKDTIFAKKSGLLSKKFIKTPRSGIVVIIDPEKGIVGIKEGKETSAVTAWFDGVVAEESSDKLIFEIVGTVYSGTAGKGGPKSGKLLVIAEKITSLELPIELDERILAVKEAGTDMVAKADTLGATAIVAETMVEPPFALPFLLVADINALLRYNHKIVIVHGDEKELLIIEEKTTESPHKK